MVAAAPQASAPGSRVHVVLVPGFAGFDALGQLEYYSGVTPFFTAWRKAHPDKPVVLHYFDNFPTAGVRTRAHRLARYLAKRLVRGEFAQGDTLALVGHSTGGLDIRQLLVDLQATLSYHVDSGEIVGKAQMFALLRNARIVFLSVPHFGTNIADWVRRHWVQRRLLLSYLRAGVEAAQWPVIEVLPDWVARFVAAVSNTNAADAVRDALDEIDPKMAPSGPARLITQAAAHEAAAFLELDHLVHRVGDDPDEGAGAVEHRLDHDDAC